MPSTTRLLACAALVALAGAGCQSEVTTSDGRPMPPRPRAAPAVPPGAAVSAMALRLGITDSNGNGFPDLIPVEVYLFSEPHSAPFHKAGGFEFALYLPGQSPESAAQPLARWRIEQEEARRRQIRHPLWGEGYGFQLSLIDAGGEQYPLMTVNLVCSFQPEDGGEPIRSQGEHPLNIGRSSS